MAGHIQCKSYRKLQYPLWLERLERANVLQLLLHVWIHRNQDGGALLELLPLPTMQVQNHIEGNIQQTN